MLARAAVGTAGTMAAATLLLNVLESSAMNECANGHPSLLLSSDTAIAVAAVAFVLLAVPQRASWIVYWFSYLFYLSSYLIVRVLKLVTNDTHCSFDGKTPNGVSGHFHYYVFLLFTTWTLTHRHYQKHSATTISIVATAVLACFISALSLLQLYITVVGGYHSPQQCLYGTAFALATYAALLSTVSWVESLPREVRQREEEDHLEANDTATLLDAGPVLDAEHCCAYVFTSKYTTYRKDAWVALLYRLIVFRVLFVWAVMLPFSWSKTLTWLGYTVSAYLTVLLLKSKDLIY